MFTLYFLLSVPSVILPYIKHREPAEILTQANHILGFGQMSLAKFLFIAAEEDNKEVKHTRGKFLFTPYS